MNAYFLNIYSQTKGSVNHVYEMLPLHLVCYDTEKDDYIYKEHTFRLSLSLFERYFYRNLHSNVATALRAFRYLYQTFPSGNGGLNGIWQKSIPKVKSTVERRFGCKNIISSYFFTNFILKMLSSGELLAKFKNASVGEIFAHFLSYMLQLMQTIPSEEVLAAQGNHIVSVGSWFFEDRTFACKTLSLKEDEIYDMMTWLHGAAKIASDSSTMSFITEWFPLHCIVPQGSCVTCRHHNMIHETPWLDDTGLDAASFGGVQRSHRCGLHQLVLLPMGVFPTFGPFDNIFNVEIQLKGMKSR